jgi:cardiolipin synthase
MQLLKRKGWGILAGIILLALIVSYSSHATLKPAQRTPAPSGSLSLITEPDAGVQPVLNEINGASKSVDLVMYQLEDAQVEQALVNDQNRGVQVRVLLNQGYYGQQSSDNEAAYNFLQGNHVSVHWTPKYFALTHQKTLIIDNKTADIMTFNLTPQYYATSRDFGVLDSDSKDVADIEATFTADWDNTKITSSNGDDLVWSPGSEATTISLIGSAKTSLDIYNEEMADSKVTTALEAAAKRGVNVEVDMTYSSDWKSAFQSLSVAGVHVRTYAASASLYIHAKMILVDNKQAFLGSENFSTSSLDDNRELGLVLQDPGIIQSLQTTFSSDYQAATPF